MDNFVRLPDTEQDQLADHLRGEHYPAGWEVPRGILQAMYAHLYAHVYGTFARGHEHFHRHP